MTSKGIEITLMDGSTKKVYPLKRTPLKRSKKPINKVSKSQVKKNNSIAKSKSNLPDQCFFSGCFRKNTSLMHILPKGGQYCDFYEETWNHTRGCKEHHELFDNNVEFRQKQKHLYYQIKRFAKEKADNYFQFNKLKLT